MVMSAPQGSGCREGDLQGRGSAGWESRAGGFSGEGVCTAGDGREVPQPPFHSISGNSCLSLPAHVSAAWSCPCQELFLCAQVSSLPVLTEPMPPAVCSALPCRPLLAAGHCPGAPLCAGAKEQLRQVLLGTGLSVPSPEHKNKVPSPPANPVDNDETSQSTDSFLSSEFCHFPPAHKHPPRRSHRLWDVPA